MPASLRRSAFDAHDRLRPVRPARPRVDRSSRGRRRRHLLINNASTAAFAGPLEAGVGDVRREMATNYDGTYATIRAFTPVLEANGGRIVNGSRC